MLEGRKTDVILEDLQEIVQESNEGEEVYSEDERANEENNEPNEQGSEEQAPDKGSLTDGDTAETRNQNIEN